MRRIILSSLLAFALVINVAGCPLWSTGKARPKLYKVSGTIKYKGHPVKGAIVTFYAEDLKVGRRASTGFTDDSGIYHLTHFDTDDGSPEGKKVVTISKNEVAKGASLMNPAEYGQKRQSSGSAVGPDYPVLPERKLPAKYADPQTSGLVRTVVPKENSFSFDLTD